MQVHDKGSFSKQFFSCSLAPSSPGFELLFIVTLTSDIDDTCKGWVIKQASYSKYGREVDKIRPVGSIGNPDRYCTEVLAAMPVYNPGQEYCIS